MIKLITALLYWLIIVPAGMVRRLFGVKDLDLRWRDGSSTYWHLRQDKLPEDQRNSSQ